MLPTVCARGLLFLFHKTSCTPLVHIKEKVKLPKVLPSVTATQTCKSELLILVSYWLDKKKGGFFSSLLKMIVWQHERKTHTHL